MSDSNEKFKWLKPFLLLFVFSLLFTTVFADNSTDYSDDDMETVMLIQPAPAVIPQCGANELYQSCEVDCINCEQRGMCEPKNCDVAHCDCQMYFVHLTPGGPCEHVSKCPPRECPDNEVYRHCGPLCESCEMSPCRTMECASRCYCKEGYRRNKETGKCVLEKECPQRLECISNDVLAESGPANEYCLPTESEKLKGNETIEGEKCYCESGFKRNIYGWCIEEASCIYVSCYDETEFQDCPRKCNTTCWNYGDPNCVEDGQCYPGCFCREGYVLNEFFACVPLESCPPGSNPSAPPVPLPTVSPIPEPALVETSNASSAETEGSSSAAVAESSSGTGSSSAAAESSSSPGSSSAAAAESSSGTGSSSAAAESSSSTGSSSAATAESSSGSGSSSAAAESSSGSGSSSAVAAESSSESGSSSAAAAASSSASDSKTETEGTEKPKETEPEEKPSEDKTTKAPKKPPKKATDGGKIYKSAARPGKTVAPPTDEEEKED